MTRTHPRTASGPESASIVAARQLADEAHQRRQTVGTAPRLPTARPVPTLRRRVPAPC